MSNDRSFSFSLDVGNGILKMILIGVTIAVAVGGFVHRLIRNSQNVHDMAYQGLSSPALNGEEPSKARHDPAPDFTMEKLGGGAVSLQALRGKVVMLDFWATWCPPCRAEMPALTTLAQQYEDRGLVFLAANQDDSDTQRTEVAAFLKKLPALEKSVLLDHDGEVATRYGVEVLPTMFFIGRDGRILGSFSSYAPEAVLRQRIERALAEFP
jgi:thiol-disulfide isomerase/thioredoxin